jgi:hypothetical protein
MLLEKKLKESIGIAKKKQKSIVDTDTEKSIAKKYRRTSDPQNRTSISKDTQM